MKLEETEVRLKQVIKATYWEMLCLHHWAADRICGNFVHLCSEQQLDSTTVQQQCNNITTTAAR